MPVPRIAGIVNERYGLNLNADNVRETTQTDTSTLYEATSQDGVGVQVEVFDAPLNADAEQLDAQLTEVNTPAVFRPRYAGRLEDGRPVVLRDLPLGTPLSKLLEEKKAAGETVSLAEAGELLQGVAGAIDAYNAAGQADFLARSVKAEQLYAQHALARVPVKMGLVGPSPQKASAEDNLRDFWNVVAEVTGRPVDSDAAAANATAAGYLAAITRPVAPGPEGGYRSLPAPYPVGAARPTARAAFNINPWPWVIGALALLLAGMLIAWWVTNRGEQWSASETQIAQIYPAIVSDKAGQRGWQSLTCEPAATDAGQEGKIRCAGPDLGVSVSKYASAQERSAALPPGLYAVVVGSGECMIDSYALPEADPPAFAMAPRDHPDYLVVLNGTDAEAMRLKLPLCE